MKWDWGLLLSGAFETAAAIAHEVEQFLAFTAALLNQDHEARMQELAWVNATREAIEELPETTEADS